MNDEIKRKREELIGKYTDNYNAGNTENLSSVLTTEAKFENVALDRILINREQIKDQIESAKDFFSIRSLTFEGFRHLDGHTEIDVSYVNVTATSFNKYKKGETLQTKAVMIFKFDAELISEILFMPDEVWFFNAMI